MSDRLRFIQFPHPGGEPTPRFGRDWLTAGRSHARKFMQVSGRWCSSVDEGECSGKLRFWGEWEAQSDLVENFRCTSEYPMMPRYLWHPYYVRRDCYKGLQNTDPFVFGDHFLYSNCRQFRHPALRHLDAGSLILYGSGKQIKGERRFVIDTVFVVRDRIPYDPQQIDGDSWRRRGFGTFLDVTGKPLQSDCCSGKVKGCVPRSTTELSLYRGATPNSPIDSMFSFFPAKSEGVDWIFARPEIRLCSRYFNPGNWRTVKGVNLTVTRSELVGIWNQIANQVLDNGLVLGTFAELPSMRG